MDEGFELPLHYKGQDLLLPAQLQTWRYSHRILVTIGEQTVIFEPDEQRDYRAVLKDATEAPDKDLIQAVGNAIEQLFK